MKILIADDSPTTRSFLKVLLNLADADLMEAADGERAYRVARLVPLDLIIADVNMPKLDGISLVQRLRAEPEPHLRSLPIVLLTGDKGPDIERRGMEAGATAFARKPLAAGELTQILRRISDAKLPTSSRTGQAPVARDSSAPVPASSGVSPAPLSPASGRRER